MTYQLCTLIALVYVDDTIVSSEIMMTVRWIRVKLVPYTAVPNIDYDCEFLFLILVHSDNFNFILYFLSLDDRVQICIYRTKCDFGLATLTLVPEIVDSLAVTDVGIEIWSRHRLVECAFSKVLARVVRIGSTQSALVCDLTSNPLLCRRARTFWPTSGIRASSTEHAVFSIIVSRLVVVTVIELITVGSEPIWFAFAFTRNVVRYFDGLVRKLLVAFETRGCFVNKVLDILFSFVMAFEVMTRIINLASSVRMEWSHFDEEVIPLTGFWISFVIF
jgi:hypothetical protein